MRKIVFILCFFFVNLFAFDFKSVEKSVLEINGDFILVENVPSVAVGANAIIVQQIKNATSIVAKAAVVGRERGLLKLKLGKFEDLEQEALPELVVSVKVGDKVIINFLYDRVLLISPDAQTYERVASSYPEIYFIHPDILGAYMVREFKLSPKKSDFTLFCVNNAVGVVGFVMKKSVKFVDCASFALLFEEPLDKFLSKSLNSTQNVLSENSDNAELLKDFDLKIVDVSKFSPNKPQTPFYSNIDEYRKNFFNFSEKKVANYYQYYDEMINSAQKSAKNSSKKTSTKSTQKTAKKSVNSSSKKTSTQKNSSTNSTKKSEK